MACRLVDVCVDVHQPPWKVSGADGLSGAVARHLSGVVKSLEGSRNPDGTAVSGTPVGIAMPALRKTRMVLRLATSIPEIRIQ